MTAEGDGGQGVVNGEVTGNVHVDGIMLQAVQVVLDAQVTRLVDALDVHRTQVGVLAHAEGLHLAGVTGHDLFQVVGVSVGDADLTVAEKHPLALDVFLHALMLAGADVVRFQIGEDGVVILEACHAAELHGLTGHLHDHVADASLGTISAKYFCTRKDSGVVFRAGMCLSPMMASMVPMRPVGRPAFSRMPRIM